MISFVYSGACARVGNQVMEPPPKWGNLIRYYDPSLGRFTQPDPTGQDPHYTYAGNNPVNFIDPSGAGACGNGIIGAVAGVGGFLVGTGLLIATPLTGGVSTVAAVGAYELSALARRGCCSVRTGSLLTRKMHLLWCAVAGSTSLGAGISLLNDRGAGTQDSDTGVVLVTVVCIASSLFALAFLIAAFRQNGTYSPRGPR